MATATENFEKKDNLKEDVPQWVTESVKAGLVKLKDDTNLTDKVNENLDDVTARTFYYKVEGDNVKYNLENVKSYLKAIKDKERSDLRDLSGAWIMAVQIALESLGYEVGKIDGIYGGSTHTGVERFQKQVGGLTVDGFPGKETITKLCEALDNPDQFVAKSESKPDGMSTAKSGSDSDKSKGSDIGADSSDGDDKRPTEYTEWSGPVRESMVEGTKKYIEDRWKAVFYTGELEDRKVGKMGLRLLKDKLYLYGYDKDSHVISNWEIDVKKCYDESGNYNEERIREEIIPKAIDELVKKRKAYEAYREISKRGKEYTKEQIFSDMSSLTAVEQTYLSDYFGQFENNKLKFDIFNGGDASTGHNDTSYDVSGDKCNIRLMFDNKGSNKKRNKWQENEQLVFPGYEIVDEGFVFNEEKFKEKLRDIIKNIINRKDFE